MENQTQTLTTTQIVLRIYQLADVKLRRLFWLLFIYNTLMGLFEIGVAGCVSLLGVAMSAPESLTNIPGLDQLRLLVNFSDTIPKNLQFLLLLLTGICCATLLKNALLAYITGLQNYFAQGIAWRIGETLFGRFLAAPHTWYASQNSAELLTILGWKGYASTYTASVLTLLTQIVVGFFLLAAALVANPFMTLILFVTIAFIGVGIQKFCKGRIYRLATSIREYDLYNSRVAMQGLHGRIEIDIYGQKKNFRQAYTRFVDKYKYDNAWQSVFVSLPVWLLELAGMCLLLFVLIIQIAIGDSVARITGTLVLLAAVSWRLLPAANKIMFAVANMRSNHPPLEKLLHYLDILPAFSLAERETRQFAKELQLRDICFTYEHSNSPTLDGLSLTIPKGSMTGIIGLSGAGKSTLVSVLIGLLQAQKGQILVDGKNLDNKTERLKIGYVPQTQYILDDTLAENVAFSHWGEPIDEERVLECCRLAAMDFAEELPDGIHTNIGERGVRLSGGQAQRVGIARALYDNPDLLVFDEATSALDSATEAAVQHTIFNLRSKVTIVIVAHRLSTVEKCHEVYWLKDGRIRMRGEPSSILAEYLDFLEKVRKD